MDHEFLGNQSSLLRYVKEVSVENMPFVVVFTVKISGGLNPSVLVLASFTLSSSDSYIVRDRLMFEVRVVL